MVSNLNSDNTVITNTNSSSGYTINMGSTSNATTAPQGIYYSTLEDAFDHIKEYLENHIGEKSEIDLALVTLDIDGERQKYYRVNCGHASQSIKEVVTIPYTQPWKITPTDDGWWKYPTVYCNNSGQAPQGTKVGCIMQSYGSAPQACV